jgi:LacI family transcriptional regulator
MSSVDVNAEGIGYEAAALLDKMMSGKKVAPKPIRISPRAVVTRRSTDVIASEDEEVNRAVRYIREQACNRLQVVDVLGFMGMSRASLQQRMKQIAGRTIHQEIQRVRLNRAKDLLSMSNLTIKQVARESGFASVQYMTRVFRSATGETPARYRSHRAKLKNRAAVTLQWHRVVSTPCKLVSPPCKRSASPHCSCSCSQLRFTRNSSPSPAPKASARSQRAAATAPWST